MLSDHAAIIASPRYTARGRSAPMPEETANKVIATIEKERIHFEAFCRSLSKEELERMVPPDNKWSVKDFAAHLATLDVELQRWFEGVIAGEADQPVRNLDGTRFDIDNWNDGVVGARHDWTLDQIFEEAASNRAKLIETIRKLTEEHVNTITRFGGDNKRPPAEIPLKLFLLGWAHHDAIHVADMLKALPERADDPALKEWLSHPAVTWYQNAMAGPATR
jgi:hypothetical protein